MSPFFWAILAILLTASMTASPWILLLAACWALLAVAE